MEQKDTISWNTMITTCVRHSKDREAFNLFQQMRLEGASANQVTYITTLNAFHCPVFYAKGKLLHGYAIHSRFESCVIQNVLVNMYGKCGGVNDALKLFNEVNKRDVVMWNSMIQSYAQNGCGEDALVLYRGMQEEGLCPNKITFCAILNTCSSPSMLTELKLVHSDIIARHIENDQIVGTALINMYSKCESVMDAQLIFFKFHEKDLVMWNAMISACANQEYGKESLHLFGEMICRGIRPNKITFVSTLDACTDIQAIADGVLVHAILIKQNCGMDVILGTSLLNMYGKCSCLNTAQEMFNNIPEKNIVSWNAMVAAYCQLGYHKDALQMFWEMLRAGTMPDEVTFATLFSALSIHQAVAGSKQIHSFIISNELKLGSSAIAALVNMYGSCGSLEWATRIFDTINMPDSTVLNAIISAYALALQTDVALHFLSQMKQSNKLPNKSSYIVILNAAAKSANLVEGKLTHAHVIKRRSEIDDDVGSALVSMYGKSGNISCAWEMHGRLPCKDTVSWTALMTSYAWQGHGKEALEIFWQVYEDGNLDLIAFVSILDACAGTRALARGVLLHACILTIGLNMDVAINDALIKMYAKCMKLEDAAGMFNIMIKKNVGLWNVMITSFLQHGYDKEVFELLQLLQKDGMEPDSVTFISILGACINQQSLSHGVLIHARIIQNRFEKDLNVTTALLEMYQKCGSLVDACRTFRKMPERDVFSCNVMMAAYIEHGYGSKALQLYHEMDLDDIKPDKSTHCAVLDACADVVALQEGGSIYNRIIGSGDIDVILGNVVINMYAKCGDLNAAKSIFNKLPIRDIVSWNTMISAEANLGNEKSVIQLVKKMYIEGMKPDIITYTIILSTCSHAGLVDEGGFYFISIGMEHELTPLVEHFGCIVDLLGRAGHLAEAIDFTKEVPLHLSGVFWTSFLSGCSLHFDMQLGEYAAEHIIVNIEAADAASFVQLCNMYAVAEVN